MSSPLPAGIPSIEEIGHSRESLVNALRDEPGLPSTEIAIATLHADVIEPDVIAVLQRALQADLDLPSGRLLFRGIHILGGRRLTAAYRPLVAFLRGPQERVEELLGAAITENLSEILAGLFDGDEKPLHELIVHASVDSFVRQAAFKALGFLAFEGRIDRAAFEAFLLRFDEERLAAADDDVMWDAWMGVVAVLGVTALDARVRAAFADGRIAPHMCDEDHFDALIKAALERPDDRERLADEQMGYLDDVLVALEKFTCAEDDAAEADERDLLPWGAFTPPTRNPYRDVGRNDPCPCGSGKKFKKCCLPQG
jgi:hypothetical protein